MRLGSPIARTQCEAHPYGFRKVIARRDRPSLRLCPIHVIKWPWECVGIACTALSKDSRLQVLLGVWHACVSGLACRAALEGQGEPGWHAKVRPGFTNPVHGGWGDNCARIHALRMAKLEGACLVVHVPCLDARSETCSEMSGTLPIVSSITLTKTNAPGGDSSTVLYERYIDPYPR